MSLRETLENIRKAPVPANEAEAKFQILAPILLGLGWNTSDPSLVGFEHSVTTARNTTGRVDIALKGSSHTVAHVEAKAPGKHLNDHVTQLLGYGFQEGVYISALTNGFEWQLYLPRESGPPDNRLFTTFNLRTDPVDRLVEDLTTFLSRNNLISGSSEKRARQVLIARREEEHLNTQLPEIWARMVNTPNEKLVDLVIEQAYQEINLRPDPKQIKDLLRGKRIVPTNRIDPGTTEDHGQKGKKRKRQRGNKPVAYVLWGHRREVRSWKELLIGLVTQLYQRHGDRILEVRGRRPYASYNEEDINRPTALGDTGIFLYANLSAENLVGRCHEYLEYLGHSPDDLTIETDEGGTPVSNQPTPPVRPSNQVSTSTDSTPRNSPRRKSSKPVAIELWGNRIEVRSWREVLVGVTTQLYRRHGHEFNRILELRGRTRPYASRSPDDFPYGSVEIANSGIYTDTNMSAEQIRRRCAELLKFFSHSPYDLNIETR